MNPIFPTGPLAGLRVLDLSRVLAGPFCTQLLGDLGAEVIKIEPPGKGDDTRHWGPPWFHGESAYFLSCNRNKKSVTVNLKPDRGAEIIRQLAARSDVFVENFKAGGLRKFGLDYEALRGLNPKLIYCSITGYGQDGPYKDLPGYDFIIQAQGGIMSMTGETEGEPCKVGVAIADIMAGMYAANAILAALVHRQLNGAGQFIDIALLDAQVSWLANVGMNYLISGETPGRYGNAHPNLVPYQVFVTADGHVAVGAGNDEQFRRLCVQLARADLAEHPSYRSNALRVQHRDELVRQLQEQFLTKSTPEWLMCLAQAKIPAAPINNVAQVFNDPQVQARNLKIEVTHPAGDKVPLIGPVAKFSNTPSSVRLPPPLLGQHTEEILRELLEIDEAEIRRLRENSVV